MEGTWGKGGGRIQSPFSLEAVKERRRTEEEGDQSQEEEEEEKKKKAASSSPWLSSLCTLSRRCLLPTPTPSSSYGQSPLQKSPFARPSSSFR